MRALGVVLMLALLAACGSESPPSDGEVRTIDRATVTDVPGGDGPILCTGTGTGTGTGPVRESAPPQCEGPVISNWDWDKVWGAYGEAGAQFGDFCFEGKDVGDEFELATLPRPVDTCDAQEYVGSATVLEDGGTFGRVHGLQLCLGPVMTSLPAQCGGPDIPNWDWDRVTGESRHSKTIDGSYVVHGVYVDGDFTLTRPPVLWNEFEGEIPSTATEGDLTSGAEHTGAELRQIQDEASKFAGVLMLMSSSGDDHVDVSVIVDEGGRLQKLFDDKYGTGTVRVSSALSKASPAL